MTADSETTTKRAVIGHGRIPVGFFRFNRNFRILLATRVMQGVRILPAVS